MADPLNVRVLICHRDRAMAELCLASMNRYSDRPFAFTLHDDGSLTDEDIGSLRDRLSVRDVIRRKDANERMDDLLRSHPACRKYRYEHPLALKLLDAVLLSGEEEIAACDTDILFLRPFASLFAFPSPDVGCLFMTEAGQGISARPWHLALDRRMKMCGNLNSGLMYLRRRLYDLDLVEWWLSRREYHLFPFWVEQTGWAILAARLNCWFWNRANIDVVVDRTALTPQLVAAHCVTTFRHVMPYYREHMASEDAPRIQVSTAPAPLCSAWALGSEQLRRRLAHYRGRLLRAPAGESAP